MSVQQIDHTQYKALRSKYMQPQGRLSNDEYQRMRRYELERQHIEEEGMQKYLDWLTGKRRTSASQFFSTHKKAQKVIQKLHKTYALYDIGNWSSQWSASVIQRMYKGDFDEITQAYAESIFYNLKKEMRKRGIQTHIEKTSAETAKLTVIQKPID